MTRTARRHKIGVAHVQAAILNAGEAVIAEDGAYSWIGVDDRGIELEIVAVLDDKREGGLAIIHVMPTEFRRKK